MNKQAFRLSRSGVVQDYGRIAVQQLLDTYVKFLDFDAVLTTYDTLVEKKRGAEAPELDLSDYLLTTSEATTKNDIVNKHMINLNKAVMKACGFGMTAILVDSEAAALLATIDGKFVMDPQFNTGLDGVVGSYNNIPVIRHHALDMAIAGTEMYSDVAKEANGKGIIIGLYKDPNGSIAQKKNNTVSAIRETL